MNHTPTPLGEIKARALAGYESGTLAVEDIAALIEFGEKAVDRIAALERDNATLEQAKRDAHAANHAYFKMLDRALEAEAALAQIAAIKRLEPPPGFSPQFNAGYACALGDVIQTLAGIAPQGEGTED